MTTPFPEDNGWPYTTSSISDDYNQVNRFPEWTQLLAGKLAAAIGVAPPVDEYVDTGWLPITVNSAVCQAYTQPPKARLRNGSIELTGGFSNLTGTGNRRLGTLPSECVSRIYTYGWYTTASADGPGNTIFVNNAGEINTRFGGTNDPAYVMLHAITIHGA